MKRPPILIIINLILLTVGCLYGSYSFMDAAINLIQASVALLFLTLGIVATFIAVFKRHARSVLFLGIFILLFGMLSCVDFLSASYYRSTDVMIVVIFLITGILFTIWGILLFRDNASVKNTPIHPPGKYKYWLYSAIFFGAGGMLFGGLGYLFWSRLLKRYEDISLNMYKIMGTMLLLSVLQFVIYYILCKIRAHKEKQINRT